jgi:hypothetical protein
MRPNLLGWQWRLYSEGHRDRRNLLIHAATVPLFQAGTLVALASPWLGPVGLAGLALLPAAMALQGGGHRREPVGPVPFAGPFDVLARIFAEQLITFPRFVLTGGFARAWRESASRPAAAA